jgi:hypothetical protein
MSVACGTHGGEDRCVCGKFHNQLRNSAFPDGLCSIELVLRRYCPCYVVYREDNKGNVSFSLLFRTEHLRLHLTVHLYCCVTFRCVSLRETKISFFFNRHKFLYWSTNPFCLKYIAAYSNFHTKPSVG